MNKNHDEIQSPCIRHCCLTDEDICVGCYRSLQEIINWSASTDDTKLRVLEAARQRKKNRENNFGK
jgi:predicted Fe-S protein YdhL (DUF1289 family)